MRSDGTFTFASLMKQDKIIEIPKIQRDYAQGRKEAREVREQFITTIFNKLMTSEESLIEPLDLDFIYGSLQGDEQENFWPLDGQQRLTTLFLLHWYLANKDSRIDHFQTMMLKEGRSRFTYETRSSSNMFFNELTKTVIQIDELPASSVKPDLLSKIIKDQKWFFVTIAYDPTVRSALEMIDTIHKTFSYSQNLYDRLIGEKKNYITFQFLNLPEFGLSDDLYIKMNARGKPLTPFENFKAKFEQTVRHLCASEQVEFHDQKISTVEYISRKLDTDWADLFWTFCDADPQKIDEQQMQFFRSIIGVLYPISTDEKDTTKVGKVLERIRDDGFEPTHFNLSALSCFNKALVLNLIVLMRHICGESGGLKTYLNNSHYYDERRTFELSLEKLVTRGREARGLLYVDAVKFYSWCIYLIKFGDKVNSKALYQWTRVVHNLAQNTRIDDVRTYTDTLFSLIELVDKGQNLIEYLATVDNSFRLQGFYRSQIREERIKSQLILKSDDWANLLYRAEQQGYFNGQIEFLLEFSGILDYFLEHHNCDWSIEKNTYFQTLFASYLEKSEILFDESGIRTFNHFLFERALLAKGDYLLKSGSNYSFLKNGFDRDLSWKRLLRGSESTSDESAVASKRLLVKALLDEFDITNPESSLQQIIETECQKLQIHNWRRLIIQQPGIIKYCQNTFIRKNGDGSSVILLKRSQTNGAHLELRTSYLYLTYFKNHPERVHPFLSVNAIETYSVDDAPTISLCDLVINNYEFDLHIHYENGSFHIRINCKNNEMPSFFVEHMEGYNNHFKVNDHDANLIMEEEGFESQIDNLLKYIAKINI